MRRGKQTILRVDKSLGHSEQSILQDGQRTIARVPAQQFLRRQGELLQSHSAAVTRWSLEGQSIVGGMGSAVPLLYVAGSNHCSMACQWWHCSPSPLIISAESLTSRSRIWKQNKIKMNQQKIDKNIVFLFSCWFLILLELMCLKENQAHRNVEKQSGD